MAILNMETSELKLMEPVPITHENTATVPTRDEKENKNDLPQNSSQWVVDEGELQKILHRSIWTVDIIKTLDFYKQYMYSNAEIHFRIGGRLIYSASRIVNAKSNSVIHETHETSDQILIRERDPSDPAYGDLDNIDNNASNYDNSINNKIQMRAALQSLLRASTASNLRDINVQSTLLDPNNAETEYLPQRDAFLQAHTAMYPFYSEDSTGMRYLAGPVRYVLKKVDLEDLSKALIKTFRVQLKASHSDRTSLTIARMIKKVLPDTILNNTEENLALIEDQIDYLKQKITHLYVNHNPVRFIEVLLSPTPEGIVNTVLYLLQLTNRKHIQVWQKIEAIPPKNSGEELTDMKFNGSDIYITVNS